MIPRSAEHIIIIIIIIKLSSVHEKLLLIKSEKFKSSHLNVPASCSQKKKVKSGFKFLLPAARLVCQGGNVIATLSS